LKKADLPLFTG